MQETFSLTGKVAVVTGGSRGIGRAIALGLAKAGADVVVASRSLPACAEVAGEIRALGPRALPVAADVSVEEQVERLFAATVAEFGRVDILVNNAGVDPVFKPATELTLAEWNWIMGVNLTGAFLCARGAARLMQAYAGGAIINIGSATSHSGFPWLTAYSASKAALVGLTRQLAREWVHDGIRVNCLVPGVIRTEMLHDVMNNEKLSNRLLRRTLMERYAKPEELVGAVLLLASGAGSYMTGSVLSVDGGWCAG